MNFAVITDVHGNAPALKAVLNEIDNVLGIEHIFCLGDMIAIGPDTNEVLEILFARNDVTMITGNHDEAVLALANEQQHPASHVHVREHHQWILDRMDPAYISELEQLPRRVSKTIGGHSILFTHYQIEEDKVEWPISEDPFSPILEPSLENMEKLFTGRSEELICFGHHHPLHFFDNGQTIYLNPGALGCSHVPAAPYAIVKVDKTGIQVDLKEAAYDNTEFLMSYEKLQVPERDFILKIFHGDQRRQL